MLIIFLFVLAGSFPLCYVMKFRGAEKYIFQSCVYGILPGDGVGDIDLHLSRSAFPRRILHRTDGGYLYIVFPRESSDTQQHALRDLPSTIDDASDVLQLRDRAVIWISPGLSVERVQYEWWEDSNGIPTEFGIGSKVVYDTDDIAAYQYGRSSLEKD